MSSSSLPLSFVLVMFPVLVQGKVNSLGNFDFVTDFVAGEQCFIKCEFHVCIKVHPSE